MPSPLPRFSPGIVFRLSGNGFRQQLDAVVGSRLRVGGFRYRRFRRQQFFRCTLQFFFRRQDAHFLRQRAALTALHVLLLAFFLLFVGALDRVNAFQRFHFLLSLALLS